MISIVTITYNNFDELVKTLNSIPESPLIESIVVNGGQCERTKEFLKTYSGKWITEKDEGIADAFNKGVKLSSGKYIMFLNSGDVLIDSKYPVKAVNYLEDHKDISFVHSNIIFSDQLGIDLLLKPQMSNVGRGMPYNHPSMIVRRTVFNAIGFFKKELNYAMDLDLVVRMEKKNLKGFYLNNKAVIKMDGSGISVRSETESILESYKILKEEKYLNLKNITGFIIRYILYLIRKSLAGIGAKSFLRKLKQIKHNT